MDLAVNLRRILVVTKNVVVGEDLREALSTYLNAEVTLAKDMSEIGASAFEVAIFGMPLDAALGDRRVRALHDAGTRIVLLNGHVAPEVLKGTGVTILPQPFTTEDVHRLMDDMLQSGRGGA